MGTNNSDKFLVLLFIFIDNDGYNHVDNKNHGQVR